MTAIGILVAVTTMCAARPSRYSSSWAWMLWAVAAMSGTIRMAGTTPMAKAPEDDVDQVQGAGNSGQLARRGARVKSDSVTLLSLW